MTWRRVGSGGTRRIISGTTKEKKVEYIVKYPDDEGKTCEARASDEVEAKIKAGEFGGIAIKRTIQIKEERL